MAASARERRGSRCAACRSRTDRGCRAGRSRRRGYTPGATARSSERLEVALERVELFARQRREVWHLRRGLHRLRVDDPAAEEAAVVRIGVRGELRALGEVGEVRADRRAGARPANRMTERAGLGLEPRAPAALLVAG